MIVSAVAKNVMISSQKVQPVLDKIRGLSVSKAFDILTFSNKKASFFIKKLLGSVVANAEHNNNLNVDQLFVYRIYVGAGPTLKRMDVKAKGKSNKLLIRSCHIFVEIKERQ